MHARCGVTPFAMRVRLGLAALYHYYYSPTTAETQVMDRRGLVAEGQLKPPSDDSIR